MRPRSGGRASHSPVKASIYLFRAVVALLLALVRDWPAQFDEGIELPELTTVEQRAASLPEANSEVRP